MCSRNRLNKWTTLEAHAHTDKLLYKRTSRVRSETKTFTCVFHYSCCLEAKRCDDPGGRSTWPAQMRPRRSTGGVRSWVVLAPVWSENITVLRSRLLAPMFHGRGFPPTDAEGLLRRLCSDASVGHRICVIAKGLGYLHRLAHTERMGSFGRLHISAQRVPCLRSRTPEWITSCYGSWDTVVFCEFAPLMVSRAAGRPPEGTNSASLPWTNGSLRLHFPGSWSSEAHLLELIPKTCSFSPAFFGCGTSRF